MRNFLARILGLASVYVVTANDEERVAAQEVYRSESKAFDTFRQWKKTYGAANVCLASRFVA